MKLSRDSSIKLDRFLLWQELVNLSPANLRLFVESTWGLQAELARRQGLGTTHTGHESVAWTLRMQTTPYFQWTPTMHKWAARQVSFISRMRAVTGPLYRPKLKGPPKPSRRLLALLIWGHDPDLFDGRGETRLLARLRRQADHDHNRKKKSK